MLGLIITSLILLA